MKRVKLVNSGVVKAKEVLGTIIKQMPQGGNIDEIRFRIRLLDKLDEAESELFLDDEQAARLQGYIQGFLFGFADRDLIAVLDAALAPIECPDAPKKVRGLDILTEAGKN
jgi:hypothetical protein